PLGGHDVANAVHLVLAVLEVRVHGDGDVREQGPRRGGPDDQLAVGSARERERDEHRGCRDFLVAERELVRREGRAAARAVRQHLVAPVQQRLVVQPLEQPPHRRDIVVGVGDVGVLVVQPVGDPLRQRFPVGLVLEDVLAAEAVEFFDAVRLDLLLARNTEHPLDLDLDGEAVGVPARDARPALPPHSVVAANQILDRAREHVMDARTPVGRRRSFVEHERRPVAGGLLGLLEQAPVLPGREELLFQRVGRELGIEERVGHQLRRSSTPPTTVASAGSAARATAMICSTDAGASASGRHWSVMIETPSTLIPVCTAVMTSGTVLIPTTSAPRARSIRYSARVSRFGPVTATYTPSRRLMPRPSATARPSARRPATYASDMSGNRGPTRSSFGPTRGFAPKRLM